jgi:hypothetical protein
MSLHKPPDWFVVKVYPPYTASTVSYDHYFGWVQGFFSKGAGANLYEKCGPDLSPVVLIHPGGGMIEFPDFASAVRYVEAQMALGILGEKE